MAITYASVYGISESGSNLIASLRLDASTPLASNVTFSEATPADSAFTAIYQTPNNTNDGWLVSSGGTLPNDGTFYNSNQSGISGITNGTTPGYEQGTSSTTIAGQSTWFFAGQVTSIANVYVRPDGSGGVEYYYDTPILNSTTQGDLANFAGSTTGARSLPDDTNSGTSIGGAGGPVGGSFAYADGVADTNGWYLLYSYDQVVGDLWSNTSGGANWNSSAIIATHTDLDTYISTKTGGAITDFPNDMDLGYLVGGTVTCFLAGTAISTPSGAVAVESLQRGDLISTDLGTMAVGFIGRSEVQIVCSDETDLPICVPAGALGASLPSADLYLSPGHALYVDGALVQASALVGLNGIHQLSRDFFGDAESFIYYSVELKSHRLITANGTAVESFYDILPRTAWNNYGEYLSIYGEEAILDELNLPRVQFERQLPADLRMKLERKGAAPLPA
ncbi:Hint domain-containing protein [Cyanobium sp. NIES-981]|uniref:Hint domain-containing protein n=1 Tax=Cyanobium sp. NIES-981 TaxID=1851505 RepID=UPI0012FAD65F|nr:Hint domain-containing protein [Cyanobium sp. NIES-981]